MLIVPSKANWIVGLVIFFIPVVGPIFLIQDGTYVSSNIWGAHLLVTIIFVLFELYVFAQRVLITGKLIKHRYLKGIVFAWKEIPFDKLKSWHVEKMRYVMVRQDGLVMEIPITLFMPHGSKIIYEKMEKNFGKPKASRPKKWWQ